MTQICPFMKAACSEHCKLNLLGRCAFESLPDVADALMFGEMENTESHEEGFDSKANT